MEEDFDMPPPGEGLDEEMEMPEGGNYLKVGEEKEIGGQGLKKKLVKEGEGWDTPDNGDEVNVIDEMVRGTKWNGILFRDVGGMRSLIQDLMSHVVFPFTHWESLGHLSVDPNPVYGILLHGPTGCGKTMLAHAIANETGAPVLAIPAARLVTRVFGACERNIRKVFAKALETAPCVVVIDGIDSIAFKRANCRGDENFVVSQLLISIDELRRQLEHTSHGNVLLIGTTFNLEGIDPDLRRSGRFDREIYIGFPDEEARGMILNVLGKKKPIDKSVDLIALGRRRDCHNFTGADFSYLIDEACLVALEDAPDAAGGGEFTIKEIHFLKALDTILEARYYFDRYCEMKKALHGAGPAGG